MIRFDRIEKRHAQQMVYEYADDMLPIKDSGSKHTFVTLDITGADAFVFDRHVFDTPIAQYMHAEETLKLLPSLGGTNEIKEVIFHDPATIVYWKDGTKTVVKCQDEEFDKEKGLLAAIAKKVYGNKGNFNNIIKKYCETVTNG